MNGNHQKPEAVVLYARVSTEDQAERQTVQGQLEFLRSFCALYGLPIQGEYVDDGWSGTIPLGQRADGSRLLQDAEARRLSTVLIYRLDRLGRSLSALLQAHAELERHGVTIRSATEPFDTSTPVGRFVFQLLGSIAELEKATIVERTTLGRDRVARMGRWTGGRIPFGYQLDEGGCLAPSERIVPELGMTEADVVRDLFRRMAEGSTCTAEARRLNAAGVRPTCRYSGKEARLAEAWGTTRVLYTLKNPCYKGAAVVRSRSGPVERPVPALVTPELWEQAARQLARNRIASKRNSKRLYLLRGLIVCGNCGRHLTGQTMGSRPYYRCVSSKDRSWPDDSRTCPTKCVPADRLESEVWDGCVRFIRDPGDALAEAQRQLRGRLEQVAGVERQRRALAEQVAEKGRERDRVMTLYRRGRISLEDVERQMEAIAEEEATLHQMADALRTQAELASAFEAQLSEAKALLARLRDRLEDVERNDDRETKRRIIELLVTGITVKRPAGGERRAEATIRYAFSEPRVTDIKTPRLSGRRSPRGRGA